MARDCLEIFDFSADAVSECLELESAVLCLCLLEGLILSAFLGTSLLFGTARRNMEEAGDLERARDDGDSPLAGAGDLIEQDCLEIFEFFSADVVSACLELELAVLCLCLLEGSISLVGALSEGMGSDAEVECSCSFGEGDGLRSA
jgi:hypothetical protein